MKPHSLVALRIHLSMMNKNLLSARVWISATLAMLRYPHAIDKPANRYFEMRFLWIHPSPVYLSVCFCCLFHLICVLWPC